MRDQLCPNWSGNQAEPISQSVRERKEEEEDACCWKMAACSEEPDNNYSRLKSPPNVQTVAAMDDAHYFFFRWSHLFFLLFSFSPLSIDSVASQIILAREIIGLTALSSFLYFQQQPSRPADDQSDQFNNNPFPRLFLQGATFTQTHLKLTTNSNLLPSYTLYWLTDWACWLMRGWRRLDTERQKHREEELDSTSGRCIAKDGRK